MHRRHFLGAATGLVAGTAALASAGGSAGAAEDETGATARPGPGALPGPVDLALVMAIDGSASISGNTLAFQLRGHAGALRDPELVRAIRAGPAGAIAATVVVWSDPGRLTVLVPWTRIADPHDAVAAADAIDAAPRDVRAGATAIGSAVIQCLGLFAAVDGAPRRTIDLTSNGFANAGPEPEAGRAAAEAAGVTVNALTILNEFPWLEDYYRDRVISGPGAFARSVADFEGFEEALRAKLIAEIV